MKNETTVKTNREGWMTTRTERADYSSYLCGQNVIYSMVTMFLTTYLLMCSIDPYKSAAVVLIVKVWDAINDVLFGVVFDKVKFKNNRRFLPWLRISLALIPLTTVLMYGIPGSFSESAKVIWFAVAYILWDTAYTLCDVPIYGIVTTMTSSVSERTSILSVSRIFAGVGAGIATVLGTILPSEDVGMSYTLTAAICSVVALLFMTPICFRGRERNYNADERQEDFSLSQMFRYLSKNKYLLIFYGADVVWGCLATAGSLNLLISYYLFHNSNFSLLILGISYGPLALFVPFVNKILARFDKAKLFTAATIMMGVVGIVQYFAGYDNMALFFGLSVLKGIPAGMTGLLIFMFTPDCAEYGNYKSGTEAKGITFAIQTFTTKLTGSVAAALGIFILGLFSWQKVSASSFEELAKMGVTQSPKALSGLWLAYTLIPAIGCLLGAVVLFFYKLNDKDVQIMAQCNAGAITREEAESRLSKKY